MPIVSKDNNLSLKRGDSPRGALNGWYELPSGEIKRHGINAYN